LSPAANTTNTTREPINLKAIQEEIKRNLQLDLMAMIERIMQPFQTDINASMAKLDTRYDELSHTVKLLQQEMQHFINQIHKAMPSLSLWGDGHS